MTNLSAQSMANPYDRLPKAPSFTVTSSDLKNGGDFGLPQSSAIFGVPGGKDLSPQLSFGNVPRETKSFMVTMWDADAPIVSGFWHWVLVDIPASVSQLPAGAGSADGKLLPKGAWHMPNDARMNQYVGAGPPPGSGKHRYYIVVTALDIPSVASLKLPKDATPALLNFYLLPHTLGRAVLMSYAEQKAK